jgi:probable phosphoglycerate mutase
MMNIPTKKIYLLRHGQIEPYEKKTFIGQSNVPLSQVGIEQAEAWQKYFQKKLPGKIFCSDLKRCVVTAKIVSGLFPERICAKKEFREISLGQWQGVAVEDIQNNFPKQWELRGNNLKGFRPPEGESFYDLSQRVLPTFYAICEQGTGDVMIVSHAGVIRVILADVLKIDLNDIFEIPQEYGALNILEAAKEGIKVVKMNQLLHSSTSPVLYCFQQESLSYWKPFHPK